MILFIMINLLSKAHDFIKDNKFANKKWKGVISEKQKVFSLVCSNGAGPSGIRGPATPLGAALHPCTHRPPEPSGALHCRALCRKFFICCR